jgi:hypothetical protein
MNTCWRCKNPLRSESLAFCPACGAAVRRDEAVARDWALRLQEGSQHLHWGLSFLWLLCGPLLLLVFPFLLARANRRLKRHHAERLTAPAFASSRFTESPEGQAILSRFRSAITTSTSWTLLQAVILYVLIAATVGAVYIVPAFAPRLVRYEDAIESVVTGGPAHRWMYISWSSPDEYEATWKELGKPMYSDIKVGAFNDFSTTTGVLPHWAGTTDTPDNHRPLRYVGRDGTTYRVEGMSFASDYAPQAHVVFLIAAISLYLCLFWFGLSFWLRFARHSQAEVLAAAYARGDLKYHDELLGRVRLLNGVLISAAIILAITPGQLVFFPFLSAVVFAHHLRWERRMGITGALGFATV